MAELVATIAAALTILGAILGVFLWLQKRLREVEREIEGVRRDLQDLAHRLDLMQVQNAAHGHQLRSLLHGLTGLGVVVARVPGIPPAELVRTLAGTSEPLNIDEIIQQLTTGNPFAVEEGNRLRTYYEMARRGERFTAEQARDFHRLSQRATEEKPTSDVLWTLLLIASVILILYALSRE